MAAIKPSTAFVNTYNKLKANGLNEKEVTTLLNKAQKEISKSKTPHALAKVYATEVKGWIKKGIAEKAGTAEMGGWLLTTAADSKAINDGVKYLKANGKALQTKHPSLKTLDFKSAKYADFGDAGYLAINDVNGKPIKDNDARAKLLHKLLGAEFKGVAVGIFHNAY